MSEESLSVVLATAGCKLFPPYSSISPNNQADLWLIRWLRVLRRKDDHTIKLWEALSGECARSIPIQTHSVSSLVLPRLKLDYCSPS